MALTEQKFATRNELNAAFAEQVADLLSEAVAANGTAFLAVSGGSTPLPFFQQLCQQAIDWSKVVVTLADERWVDNSSADSNEKLVRENLLVEKAAAARFFPLKTSHSDAFDAVSALAADDAQPKLPFDVLILGMGGDAHTASLFPCCAQIDAGLDLKSGNTFIAIEPTTAPHQRMSYTLPALVSAKNIFLHLTGAEKLSVLEHALSVANAAEKPIKAVVENADVNLVWAP